jgi:protein-L-isoaspartate(D-aspartate) O-methyltransferase
MTLSEPQRMLATVAQIFARTAKRTGFDAPGPAVAEAMARVPRARFVPEELAGRAHEDAALSLPCGQTISQPFIVALMTSLLRPRPEHRVLEIGTGSGYQAAILGELVQQVHTVEIVPELAATASAQLRALGYDNVQVHDGDGANGWPEHAPYDGILVACGSESVPPALIEQLAPHGHLVIPVGPRDDQRLLDITKDANGAVQSKEVLGVRFVPFVRARQPHHERFDDPRGIGVRVTTGTQATAFAELALAISSLVAAPERVRPERRVEFACSAATSQQLLSRWLDEVAWALQRQQLVFHHFDVRLRGDSLRGTGYGEPLDPARHRPNVVSQTIALLDPRLEGSGDDWRAQCSVTFQR